MRASSFLMAAIVVMSGACRTRPVSVVTPEVDRDVADLTPISPLGDTSWRVSAASDIQTHSHGGQAVADPAPVVHAAPVVHTPAAAPAAPSAPARSAVRGFAAISPQAVNIDPSPDDFTDDEGPAVLRAQVLLDRAHFSSGVLNGKAGQNTSKAILFF